MVDPTKAFEVLQGSALEEPRPRDKEKTTGMYSQCCSGRKPGYLVLGRQDNRKCVELSSTEGLSSRKPAESLGLNRTLLAGSAMRLRFSGLKSSVKQKHKSKARSEGRVTSVASHQKYSFTSTIPSQTSSST